MRIYFLALSAAFFLFLNVFGQTKNDETIATVNNEKITAGDFRLRFELSPYLSSKYDAVQADSLKADFLYSLIAEKLWAIESGKEGLTQSAEYKFLVDPLRDMFLRDGLFKEAVENKIKISADDLDRGIRLFGFKISARVLSSIDSVEIYNAYSKIQGSQNPDSLISGTESLKAISTKVEEIKFGSLRNEALEDMVFSLKPGQFTKPMKQDAIWFIFLIENRISETFDLTDQKTVNDIKSRVRDRRIEKLNKIFLDSLLGGRKIPVNRENFFTAADRIISLMQQDTAARKDYYLQDWQYKSLINSGDKDFLDKVLFTSGPKNFTIFDFLSCLAFDEFKAPSTKREVVLSVLHKKINEYIPQQVLVNEALKRGIQNYPSVKSDLMMWEDHYSSNEYRLSFKDSVKISDDDVYNYYLKKSGSGQMKMLSLALITSPDLNLMGDILDRLKQGKDFNELAAEFGKSDPLVNEKGLTGLVSALELGEIGIAADRLKEGEIYGPMKRGDGYSIFKVLEKRNSSDSVKTVFENVKTALRNELYNNKLNEFLTRKTAGFANKNKIRINAGILKGITINTVPMFVHRIMGFGGRIAGVPFTTAFSDWVDEIEKSRIYP